MKKESNCCNSPSAQGICRRDFLKLAGTACLLAGCSAGRQPSTAPTRAPTTTLKDFSKVAYCGIRCQEVCPDGKYPTTCEGCKSESEKLSYFCKRCTIRQCGMKKQVVTCAHCDDYYSCSNSMWKTYPILREYVEQIRRTL